MKIYTLCKYVSPLQAITVIGIQFNKIKYNYCATKAKPEYLTAISLIALTTSVLKLHLI